MRIGIIGAGRLGEALAHRLGIAGHDVMLSYSRDDGKLAEMAARHSASAGSAAEAAAFGDVLALAVTWPVVPDAIANCGRNLDGKVLWDCTNPIRRDMSGLEIGTETSGAETIATLAPTARVVKGVPTFADLLMSPDPTIAGRPVSTFVAGNDPDAKTLVTRLLTDLPTEVTDAGELEAARVIEPTMMLLVRLAYRMGMGPRLALNVVR